MAQLVSHMFLTAERERFDPRPVHVGFLVDKVALEQIFLRVIWYFLLSVSFH
jgi:hypothetical protein